MKRLTDVNFWEESWKQSSRPHKLWLYRDFDFETIRVLREFGGPPGTMVVEVGAGGSRVLPYLQRKLGYKVFGSDFSPQGCRLLRANLELQGGGGGVVCEDLFQSSFPPETFDLVFSSGLIEHFDDTRAVIAEHLRLVKPGGGLVLLTPNLQGVNGKVVKRLAPPFWSVHRIFGPDDMAKILESLGMEKIRSGYLGSFLIQVGRGPEWSTVQGWPSLLQALVCGFVRLANGIVSLLFRLSPLRPHSRALSPACFAAARKPRK